MDDEIEEERERRERKRGPEESSRHGGQPNRLPYLWASCQVLR
jgi:hypothetical protein